VTLPFDVSTGTAAASVPEPVDLRGTRVLVVDDNHTNREILDIMLRAWGMAPVLAEGGAEGLAALEAARARGQAFDLVLLDFQMPDMDGFEVAERISGHPEYAATTIMMLSSVGEPGGGARGRELGVSAYLTKPVRQPLLHDAICTALAKKRVVRVKPPALVAPYPTREATLPLSVLLAEDNLVNAHLATVLLRKAGHRVTLVTTGRLALEALEKERYDVVLMDVQMPDMDGLAATAAIRLGETRTGRHVPIIALTAHAMADDRRRCLDAGSDGYLSKPFSPPELYAALEEVRGLLV
jgi:CheY-like chemotaxis protein